MVATTEKKAVKTKSLQDYLNDDPSLREKISYEEFMAGKAAPKNSDIPFEEAFRAYQRVAGRE